MLKRKQPKLDALTGRILDRWREHGQPDSLAYADVAPLLAGCAQSTITAARRRLAIQTIRERAATGHIIRSRWDFRGLRQPEYQDVQPKDKAHTAQASARRPSGGGRASAVSHIAPPGCSD